MTAAAAGMTPQEFFEDVLPDIFTVLTKANPIPDMEGTEFTMQVNLEGEDGIRYGVTIKDARELDVSRCGIEKPVLELDIPEPAWKKAMGAVAGGGAPKMPEGFDPTRIAPNRGLYEAMKEIEGRIELEILDEAGEPMIIGMTINGAGEPAARMSASSEIFRELMTGDPSDLPRAFMSGRLKIDGDMPFIMKMGAVMAQNLA